MKKIICLILGSLLLAACSSPYSTVGENIYLKSRNGPKVVVPPPLSSANISSFYVLPNMCGNPIVNIYP